MKADRIWQNVACDEDATAALSRELGVSSVTARLLCIRGLGTLDEARRFLSPRLDDLHDPFALADMSTAVDRILTAIESGLLAAEAILEAGPGYGIQALASYTSRVRQRFGLRPGARSRPLELPGWTTAIASRALLGIPWLTRRILLEEGFLHNRRPDLTSA